MFPVETDSYKVILDDTSQVGILHWKRGVNLPEYQSGIRALIKLIEECGLKRSLMNSTLRGNLNFESDEWIFNALKTEVANIDHKEHQLALVMSEERYLQLVQNYSLLQAGSLELPLNINYFTNMDEALHWLLHENFSIY